MIFLGDIASPSRETTGQLARAFIENQAIFNEQKLICNFEGLISERKPQDDLHPVLFNHSEVLDTLNRGAAPVLCLANNHILDLPDEFGKTLITFQNKGVVFCGAGRSKEQASQPVIFLEDKKPIILFNACWDFLLYNHRNPSKGVFVSEINESLLLKEVIKLREKDKKVAIVLFFHWSFDLENLPFPMYRSFSKDLIDAGANVVVGAHSHCFQGGEKYQNGYIIYGLGNFYMPNNTFAGGRLTFPDFARIQLALEWNQSTGIATCHWFMYSHENNNHRITFLSSEKFEDSVNLTKLTPYANMSDHEYIDYFKKHRRKKLLVPVFKDYRQVFLNKSFTNYLKLRAHLLRFLSKYKLRKWQN